MTTLSPKQNKSIVRAFTTDKRIIANAGAIRSGKTYVNNLIFLGFLDLIKKDDPNAQVILGGWSQSSIDRNVTAELKKLGADVTGKNNLYINGVKIVDAYTGIDRGADKIQGMTANFAYVNEAALATPYVFNQILQRVSTGHYQKILIDANPKGPTHWLKRDYIDTGEVEYTQYMIDDNTTLDPEYIDFIKRTNKGDLYRRNVLGEWSAGDLILPFETFDQKQTPFIFDLPFAQGMDLGATIDPSVYVRVYVDEQSKRLFVTDAQFEQTDSNEKIEAMIRRFMDNSKPMAIDTNFPTINNSLIAKGFRLVPVKGSNTKGRIEDGLLKLNNYDLFIEQNLTEMIKELSSYERNSDGVVSASSKKHDHSIDALRYAIIVWMNSRGLDLI